MKKFMLSALCMLCFYMGMAQSFPEKTNKLVNDFTQTLTSEQIAQLERKLVAFDDSTSNQVAVVLVKTVGDYDINEYALELGRKWGIGGKTKNNGVILLVAIGDRKVAIQTGYGLEGALPDIYTKRIIENDIKPNFKAGDYYAGIEAGTNSIISLTKGEYKNDQPKSKSKRAKSGSAGLIVIIIIVIIIFILGKRGGGGGGGSQVISGRGVAEGLLWGLLLGGGGRGGSGSGFGGGFGGGSSGGGGFGGFGGGSFGGGGSSGSW